MSKCTWVESSFLFVSSFAQVGSGRNKKRDMRRLGCSYFGDTIGNHLFKAGHTECTWSQVKSNGKARKPTSLVSGISKARATTRGAALSHNSIAAVVSIDWPIRLVQSDRSPQFLYQGTFSNIWLSMAIKLSCRVFFYFPLFKNEDNRKKSLPVRLRKARFSVAAWRWVEKQWDSGLSRR